MPDPTPDVTPESSSGPQDPDDQDAAPVAVTTDVTPEPQDRPVENLKAEFDRKFGDLSRQLSDFMAVVASNQAPQPNQTRQGYSDEQLAELARAGSVDASLQLQQRVAERAAQSVVSTDRQAQFVQSQLATLYGKYPELSNPQHPLTVEAMKAKSVLLRTGRANNAETDLEAIKLAIVDNRHLAGPAVTPNVAPQQRQPSVQPQTSLDGSTTRREPARPNQPGRKIHPKVAAIAKRMGIKDPEAALARHDERHRKGQSAYSPGVAMIVREQE